MLALVSKWLRPGPRIRALLVAEEVPIVHRVLRELDDVPRVMIDVGAHVGSTLHPFVRDGWQVYAFEPDANNRSQLLARWGDRANLVVDPRAVSDSDQLAAPFFGSDLSSGISSLTAFHPSHRLLGNVETITLRSFCRQRGLGRIGLLKIDVEGLDLFVLRGLDWQESMPEFVVCEFEDAKTEAVGYNYHELAQYLMARGYSVLVSEWYPVQRYGQSHRWRRLASYPSGLIDPRAFGNLIAARRESSVHRIQRLVHHRASFWRATSAFRQWSGI